MKTKDLIKMLQREDPTGEEHCCVGNVDISWVGNEPAYWDGNQQIILYNEKGEIIGGKYHRNGQKIQIHIAPFSDLIWDRQEDFVIDYSELCDERKVAYKKNHDKIISDSKALDLELDLEYFVKHIKERVEKIMDNDEGVEEAAKNFYMKNLNPYIKIPEDIPVLGNSFVGRRNIQWGRELEVFYDRDHGLVIRKLQD